MRTTKSDTSQSWGIGFQWWVMLLLMWLSGNAEATVSPLQLMANEKQQSLNGHVEFIFDSTSNLSREDVVQSDVWQAVGDQPYTKGVEEGVVWLRFSIHNSGDEPIHRAIHISHGLADTATAWITQPDGSISQFDAGEDTLLEDRVFVHFHPRFPVDLDPGEQVDVLLKMADEGTMSVPIEVAKYDHLEANDGTRQWINGLMTGVLGLVGFYGLALWTRIRHRIFGWLTGLAFASLMQWMFYHWGHAGTWIAPSIRPWMVNRLIVACFELTAGFSFFFYIEACQLNRYHPRLTRIIQTFAWVGIVNAGLIFVIPYPVSVQVLFLGVFGLAFLAVTVVIRSVQGDPVSRRMVMAACLLLVGYLLSLLTESGTIGRNAMSPYYIPLGILAQWLLFSEAIAMRAKKLEEQRRSAIEAKFAEERRIGELREAFGRYVAPDLAEKILDSPEATALGGRLQTITILMSDLRGFTGMTRRLGPPAMCELLNDYLGRMTEVIERHGGWVNEFIGDAILAVFGTPKAHEDDPLNACRCAIEMQIALDQMNQELRAAGRPALEMGIGIHSGEAVVGNIGSSRKVKWGVIGDAVNMTARIESLTIGTQILISGDLLNLVEPHVETSDRKQVKVKGRTRFLEVGELFAIPGDGISMPKAVLHPLIDTKRAAEVYRLEGKVLAEEPFVVDVVRMGPAGIIFENSDSFETGTDLAVRIEQGSDWTEPIYGKVGALPNEESTRGNQVSLIFTSLDPVTRAWLERLSSSGSNIQ